MKTVQIKAEAKVTLNNEEGNVKLILEIPYPESIFKDWNRVEELDECLTRGEKALKDKGIKADQKEDVFIKIEQQTYSPIVKQLVNYLAATLTSGISNMEILSLLQARLEEIRREAIEILERNQKNAKKWS